MRKRVNGTIAHKEKDIFKTSTKPKQPVFTSTYHNNDVEALAVLHAALGTAYEEVETVGHQNIFN